MRPGWPASGRTAYVSAGLHPWFLSADTLDRDFAWLEEQASKPEVLAIGEAGLDKLTETPWDLQLQAFKYCVEIADRVKKPLVVHCVRAYAELIESKKQWKSEQPWIIHGFDKHPQTGGMLLSAGCYLSFGKALFRPNSHAAAALQATPAGRFFLETDDAEDLDIGAVYQKAAQLRGISLEEMAEQLSVNAQKLSLWPDSGVV